MEGYRKSSHAVYRCEYHFVWIPKYRYQVLVKEVKSRLKEILIELCEWLDVDIIEGAIASDHVHMYVSVPPKYSPSHVMTDSRYPVVSWVDVRIRILAKGVSLRLGRKPFIGMTFRTPQRESDWKLSISGSPPADLVVYP
jgi:hypothetical protein